MQPSLEATAIDRNAAADPQKKSAGPVEILDPLTTPNWDAQVMALPGYSPFHSVAWARVLQQAYDYNATYVCEVNQGVIRAVLPMMEVRSWLTGNRGVALPFTDSAPALGDAKALFRAATDEGSRRGWKYWECRGGNGIEPGATEFGSYHHHKLELTPDQDALWKSFDGNIRTSVRKAEKAPLVLERTHELEGMRIYYDLHCMTRQKHGVPPQPFDFFETFHSNIVAKNNGFVTIARYQGLPVAASVFLHFGKRAVYKWSASDLKYLNFRGPNYILWHSIQWYAQNGFELLDFGRCDKDNEGLRHFKLQFAATEQDLRYYRYDLHENKFLSEPDPSPGMREKVMQKLPIPVARIIGSMLYKHVA